MLPDALSSVNALGEKASSEGTREVKDQEMEQDCSREESEVTFMSCP